ncbi:RICIN domain-containing protein [Lentzea flava]|uniref:Ricin B lectin domain-containing protein n=1 Tax=Lentzea flava TaxID=103732 RepID=A0ABQ2UHR0_9PSEU|nr:RICIN domain-containing protein [Lentzea flava]MCP2199258.1 Ricin-type beta-trefoil lectin domain-containing protein [Lentzea flava]GGU36535.1 hypothetical protein GCM10010178_31040 [Lentzea flava]
MGKIPAAVCAAILGVAGLAAPAQAAAEPVTFFKFYGSGTGGKLYFPGTDKCLDAALEEIDRDGGKVQMWTCGFGGDEQEWRFEHSSDPYEGSLIINVANGKCLDVALEEIDLEGGKVQMYQCTGGIEQRWYVSPHQGDILVKSRATKGLLGVPSVYDGAPVGIYGKA